MLFLFLLIPSIFLLFAGILYFKQLQNLSTLLISDSKNVVTSLSEDIIADIARSVGKQCKLYWDGHPKMPKEDFNTNVGFKSIAFVKVGQTGYTALYERPSVADGMWPTWVHPNSKLIGTDLKSLEKKLPEFWKILSGVRTAKKAKDIIRGRIRIKKFEKNLWYVHQLKEQIM